MTAIRNLAGGGAPAAMVALGGPAGDGRALAQRQTEAAVTRREERVVVTVCTRQRPRMLQSCLHSLAHQSVPDHVSFSIVVVENNESDACRTMVEKLAAQAGTPSLTYAHEPRIGIPIARNRTLDLALEQDADWIAFIDDDEVADPHWIANLMQAAQTHKADVLQGRVEWSDEGSGLGRLIRDIRESKSQARGPTGTRLDMAATNCTMMRASIARIDGWGLRFNEAMRFSGGSDSEFFSRAATRGAVICWVEEAVVQETMPVERLTLRYQLQRERRGAANNMRLHIRGRGLFSAIRRKGPKVVLRLMRACVEIPAGLALFAFSRRRGSYLMAIGCRRLSAALGIFAAFLNITLEPYRTTEGY